MFRSPNKMRRGFNEVLGTYKKIVKERFDSMHISDSMRLGSKDDTSSKIFVSAALVLVFIIVEFYMYLSTAPRTPSLELPPPILGAPPHFMGAAWRPVMESSKDAHPLVESRDRQQIKAKKLGSVSIGSAKEDQLAFNPEEETLEGMKSRDYHLNQVSDSNVIGGTKLTPSDSQNSSLVEGGSSDLSIVNNPGETSPSLPVFNVPEENSLETLEDKSLASATRTQEESSGTAGSLLEGAEFETSSNPATRDEATEVLSPLDSAWEKLKTASDDSTSLHLGHETPSDSSQPTHDPMEEPTPRKTTVEELGEPALDVKPSRVTPTWETATDHHHQPLRPRPPVSSSFNLGENNIPGASLTPPRDMTHTNVQSSVASSSGRPLGGLDINNLLISGAKLGVTGPSASGPAVVPPTTDLADTLKPMGVSQRPSSSASQVHMMEVDPA